MAVIAINKILDEVRAKYLPGAKVPLVMITAEMQMFPINQVVTRGWPLLQAILKPGLEVNTHVWAQLPKSILKGKGVDPLERGGAMEAGGSKLEGKQPLDVNQGGKGGEKGKKKEKKEKKEKKIEKVATGSDGGQESWVVRLESGGPISRGDLGAGTAEEHRGRTQERKLKKHSRTQSQSQSQSQFVVSKPWKIIDAQDQVQAEASTSSNPATTQALPEAPTPPPFNNACDRCIWQTKDCTRRLEKGISVGECLPCHKGKVACNLPRLAKRPRVQSRAPVQALEPSKAPSPGPSKGPTRPSARATLKPPVTPSKQAPSLGPDPSPSKKAKASVSRSRPKTPLLAQKEKFTNDAGVTPSSSIKLIATPVNPLLDPRPGPSSDLTDQIIKGLEVCVANLEKQVERIPDLELQLSSMAQVIEALREQSLARCRDSS
ncbi:hypothetical protein PAXRUDRAFT_21519 [Paxillus rubicundulus Ve08.2h10]|uniref:Zn(2)-C6 fungal-type domain-containing protein n=1 Tax=Paxillus rubicundulus Ve08.2h10 TaxID=930991 RepID=A0A0D0CPU9_9AGAM|nr:hypothetical protein PAXRUDRAFT_21519 [Paxillus rubicundulus Ve08.2h10]